jgi:hypothetical protein
MVGKLKFIILILLMLFSLTSCTGSNDITLVSATNKPNVAVEKRIKGNINSKGEKIYHMPNGAYYSRTDAEEYFATEDEAKASGFRRAKR